MIETEEVVGSLDAFVAEQLHFLKPVEECWQPSDILPDMTGGGWREGVEALRRRALGLPDDVLVVLVGNLITEEALPSYQTWLNRVEEIKDPTGASQSPWALWTRRWTAEESRHGELLSRYLYLSGRVDLHSVEVTIQHLIRNGFDLKSGSDPYKSLVYAAFQERGTKISHANTGRHAQQCGDELLARMCALIAGDEARHEEAYKRIYGKIIEMDPERAVCAFAVMMRQKVVMPARLMSDGTDRDIFSQFAVVAQRSGIYTIRDYADVIAHLVDYWNIPSLLGLTGEAARAQEYLCGLAEHYLSKAEKTEEITARLPEEPFSWIFGRRV
jgi:acyl-[acyl-carrier-protein] desaturase